MSHFSVFDIITALLIGAVIGMIIGVILVGNADDFDKFCPECGHHYTSEVEYCSYDGSELKKERNND